MTSKPRRILVIGRRADVLQRGVAALNHQGFAAVGTVGDSPDTEFHAGDFDLITIGGGVDAATRERLRARFKEQNKNVMLLDVYAPIAGQQIARALKRNSVEGELASAFSVTEGADAFAASVTIEVPCLLRLDIYSYRGSSLEPEIVRVADATVSPGAHVFKFEKELARDGFMVVLTLNDEEHHLHRLEEKRLS
ncbi:hypothetical protein [Sorangium sp. So ce1078]|uniref:hypothetical protein n=1 Tax=Sorangium sp. So ce1078 TaxID=3133329 RepID=UPI003F624F58